MPTCPSRQPDCHDLPFRRLVGNRSNINTANGVIENGAEVGVNESLVSEARFFRAFDYFLLVQTFGGVPLTWGPAN